MIQVCELYFGAELRTIRWSTFISEFHRHLVWMDQRLQLCGHIRVRVIKQNRTKVPKFRVGAPEAAVLAAMLPSTSSPATSFEHASSQRGANRSLWARDGRPWVAASRALGRDGAGIDDGDCREERPRLPRKDDASSGKFKQQHGKLAIKCLIPGAAAESMSGCACARRWHVYVSRSGRLRGASTTPTIGSD